MNHRNYLRTFKRFLNAARSSLPPGSFSKLVAELGALLVDCDISIELAKADERHRPVRRSPSSHPSTAQPCPDCDGSMPPESVQIGEWTLDISQGRPVNRRVLSMHCPHCGRYHHRVETQPVNAWIV